MSRVDQTIFVNDPKRKGNCVSACVATLLGVPIDRVPHFVEYGLALGDEPEDKVSNGNAWWAMMLGYFYGAGYELVEVAGIGDAEQDEYLLVAGMSPRGVLHQVIYRDGHLWHDPHPSRDGVIDVQEVLAVRPLSGFDHSPTQLEEQD